MSEKIRKETVAEKLKAPQLLCCGRGTDGIMKSRNDDTKPLQANIALLPN